ncbi:Nrap protein [Coniella lustricola]|uniref:U3 small nucleolar RNA-associated protein 22 n=1 Tax=Coniella lustricola TaxID=2025994 RepID=A0A2T2ZYY1_9PEZI|nr:Nrap protein [Coniella lustricola]
MDSNPAKRRKLDHQASQNEPAATLDAIATASASRSGAFGLQSNELLEEIRLDYDKVFSDADRLLYNIKAAIEAVAARGPTPILQAAADLAKRHHVVVPFPEPGPPSDCPYKVSYAKPAQVNVVGSYISRTMIKSQECRAIDMVVEMPRELFQDKDYLDLRYFYKRAYYLAVLSTAAQDAIPMTSAKYEYLHGNRLLPVLALDSVSQRPAAKGRKTGFQIRIIPCAPLGLFPPHRLLSSSNCIRFAASEDITPKPTPFYNNTLKAESCYLSYLKVIRQAEKTCAAYRDACILGRVWLQQRGLGASISDGGFGNFEWSVLTALLLVSGGRKGSAALSPSLSSIRIFKAVIQFLAAANLEMKPLVLGRSKEGTDATKEPVPVIFDTLRQLNVAYKMSPWSAALLQHFAKWTHATLTDQEADHFRPTFITKVDSPFQCYDLVVRIGQLPAESSHQAIEYRGNWWRSGDKIAQVIKRALGDRAQLVHVQNTKLINVETWGLGAQPSNCLSSLLIGIIFDDVNAARQVDHGPAVEEKEASQKFRQFWGEKAELRRFRDGSILESLIWTQSSPITLSEEIIRYILKLHLKIQNQDMQFLGKAFSSIIPVKSSDTLAFQAARRAFATFERDIRDLSDLPLQVRQIATTAPALRFASVHPTETDTPREPSRQAMDVTIYFEASGKWPDNLAAIQRTKIAFLLKIGDMLAQSKPAVVCRVGLEDVHTDVENLAFLDISYEDGATFRLRIHSDTEESLLERRTKDKTLDQRTRAEGAKFLASFKRRYTHLPLHTQMISTLCARFPALSPTIRLLKQWFNSHRLSYHFLEEMIELLALRAFLEPYPWQAPTSGMTGFLRTLQFLSRWDWRLEPLTLDSSGTLSGADRSTVETRLEAWRKIDPGMSHTTLFVVTSHDTSGTAYTIHDGRPYPSKVVATRMTTLARAACTLVKDKGISLIPKLLFQPSLAEYDVVIHLNSKRLKAIGRGEQRAKSSHFKNLDGLTGEVVHPILQEPAIALVQELDSLFHGPLLLFHGAPDDAIVAGLWNPQFQRRTFRVNLPCSFRPLELEADDKTLESEELVEVDRNSIIAEIARIGGDCIERIDLPKLG